MVGYTDNGYRLWCLEQHRIICSRDVIFDERKFKHHQLFVETNVQEQLESDCDEKQHEEEFTSANEEYQEQEFTDSEPEDTEEKEQRIPRRSGRETKTPAYLKDYCVLTLHAESYVEDIPNSCAEINSHEDKEEWHKAVAEKLKAIEENKVWKLTELLNGKKAIDNKWIFKIKRDEYGNIQRYKARLVAKGCLQKKGFDYNETYAPVTRLTTLRILLSIIVNEDFYADQLDVKNAFLHGILTTEIYLKQPEGCEDGTSRVCKLNKTLYGLKQSPRTWNSKFNNYMKKIGLKQSEYDKCMFYESNNSSKIYLLLYVDDIIITQNDRNRLNKIKGLLEKRFSMKDLGPLNSFLGIKIRRNKQGMDLNQSLYIQKLLKRFGMEDCKPQKTPMETNSSKSITPQTIETENEKRPYRELIGCLMYVMVNTRPDISAAVNYYSRFQETSNIEQWKGLKRILRYLKGSINMCLSFQKNQGPLIAAYADADWVGDLDRKSTTGFLIEIYGNPVCWVTKKQSTVALSSTEAEYVALAMASTEVVWIKNFLWELGWREETPVTIYEDNQSCIYLLSKWEHQRLNIST